jgi:hypothetical protein
MLTYEYSFCRAWGTVYKVQVNGDEVRAAGAQVSGYVPGEWCQNTPTITDDNGDYHTDIWHEDACVEHDIVVPAKEFFQGFLLWSGSETRYCYSCQPSNIVVKMHPTMPSTNADSYLTMRTVNMVSPGDNVAVPVDAFSDAPGLPIAISSVQATFSFNPQHLLVSQVTSVPPFTNLSSTINNTTGVLVVSCATDPTAYIPLGRAESPTTLCLVRWELRGPSVPGGLLSPVTTEESQFQTPAGIQSPVPNRTQFLLYTAPTGVEEGTVSAEETAVQVTPNPMARTATISYSVAPHSGPVEIRIFDAGGRCVRTIDREEEAAGKDAVRWDGRDDHGRVVPDGVYICHVGAAGKGTGQKVVVMR